MDSDFFEVSSCQPSETAQADVRIRTFGCRSIILNGSLLMTSAANPLARKSQADRLVLNVNSKGRPADTAFQDARR
jgi:hypothetical protein